MRFINSITILSLAGLGLASPLAGATDGVAGGANNPTSGTDSLTGGAGGATGGSDPTAALGGLLLGGLLRREDEPKRHPGKGSRRRQDDDEEDSGNGVLLRARGEADHGSGEHGGEGQGHGSGKGHGKGEEKGEGKGKGHGKGHGKEHGEGKSKPKGQGHSKGEGKGKGEGKKGEGESKSNPQPKGKEYGQGSNQSKSKGQPEGDHKGQGSGESKGKGNGKCNEARHTPCLHPDDVDVLVDAYVRMLSHWNDTDAKYLAENFRDTSDSINILAGIALGSPTFPTKQAFIDHQHTQPDNLPLKVTHKSPYSCDEIALIWKATFGKAQKSVRGVTILGATKDADFWQLKTIDVEFNSLAYLLDIGGNYTLPPPPPASS